MLRVLIVPVCLSATLFAAASRLPVVFEPNRGQARPPVDFVARMAGGAVQLSASGAKIDGRSSRFALVLQGAGPSAAAQGEEALPGVVNYLGSASGIPTYSRVRYRGIYPGIDMVYYSRNRLLEYDFEVAAGADPGRIRLCFEGVPLPRIDRAGDLVFQVGLKQHRPVVYQEVNGVRQAVSGRYRLRGRTVGFAIGPYDHTRPLIIDPVITWATYFGGASSDNGESLAVDPAGNIYIAGSTLSPFGDFDVYVAKLSPDGARSIYTTLFPGGNNDYGHAVAADSAGNVYVAGETSSTDFAADFTYVSRNAVGGVRHVFVSKLDTTGRSLIYSHYVAGAGQEIAYGMALDAANNVWIAGATTSADFPVTAGTLQTTRPGSIDAFVMRFDAAGNRSYATFLGGAGDDYGYGIALDASGNAFVTGATNSSNFPVSSGVRQPLNAGGFDAFVTKLSPTGTLVYSSYVGGSGDDFGNAIAVDSDSAAYLTGETVSTDFPSVNPLQPASAGGGGDIFVAKLAGDAASLVYSTYLGGAGEDLASSIALDSAGDAFLIGSTTSTDFPVNDAFQASYGGGATNAVVAALDASGSKLLFSSYLGGSGTAGTAAGLGDSGGALAMSCASGLVLLGNTASTNFPATPGAYSPGFGGGVTDAFVAKLGVGGVPAIAAGGVVNSATFSAGNLAPGSLVSIFGSVLALGPQQAKVTVNDAPVPILAATAGQINIQLPYDVAPGTASVIVSGPCGPSAPAAVQVSKAAPYLMQTAAGDAAATNADNTANAAANPAKTGSVLAVKLIGIGPLDNPVPAGTPAPADPPSKAVLAATATIGGIDATIQFLGLIPGSVGLAQARLVVPQLAPGAYPVAITVGGVTSNSAMVYVQ